MRQKEFPNTFNVLNNMLVCICCGHLVSWKHKVSIITHINSKTHKKNKQNYDIADQNSQFQTLEDSFSIAESKKVVVKDLVEAFVKANIPLEKVNALQPFFKKYCKEDGSIPQADALRR
ncbi:18574_t:CDS:1 [Gigaspora margarita]|uniref:18574_t:CDS:1 n=1 Tax=Gigaspora margarita TaxID=4874 RepID=A0ABN7VTA6_GIGMA|nr:18574_t:CDS:1 [Gigaspora margarita]